MVLNFDVYAFLIFTSKKRNRQNIPGSNNFIDSGYFDTCDYVCIRQNLTP